LLVDQPHIGSYRQGAVNAIQMGKGRGEIPYGSQCSRLDIASTWPSEQSGMGRNGLGAVFDGANGAQPAAVTQGIIRTLVAHGPAHNRMVIPTFDAVQ
jgi:hypothetical protein